MQPKISFCLEWKMVSNLMRHSANACTTCVEAANLTGMQLFILEYLYPVSYTHLTLPTT